MAHYDRGETERRLITPPLPNKPRGVARVDDRPVVNKCPISRLGAGRSRHSVGSTKQQALHSYGRFFSGFVRALFLSSAH